MKKTLYDRLTRDFAEQGSHSAQGALAKLLPNSMRPVAVEKWGIDPHEGRADHAGAEAGAR